MTKKDTFYPKSQKDWRKWLSKNHIDKQSIWVIFYRTSSDKPSLTWSEAVDEALCFGWIDSTRKSIDSESYMQYFTKRKPRSTWSKINKDKVKELIDKDLMTKAGLDCIEVARENGSWTILDSVEDLIVPEILEIEFQKFPNAGAKYEKLSNSAKKSILHRIAMAKQLETKKKRAKEAVEKLRKS